MEIKINNKNILKLTLQVSGFVCSKLTMINDYPVSDFPIQLFTWNKFFEKIHHLINVKIHLHHSHVIGKTLKCSHDFCICKVRENQISFSCLDITFFGFDFYFLLKGIRLSVRGTKDIIISGTNLIKINFANIGTEAKFVDRHFEVLSKKFRTIITNCN